MYLLISTRWAHRTSKRSTALDLNIDTLSWHLPSPPSAPFVCSPCCEHWTQASSAQYNALEDKGTDSLPCQIYPECYYGAMATDEDMQASLDGGTAGSLVFSARLTGRKAPRGCYGNRLIICREGLLAATATWGPSRQFPPLSRRKLDWLWWGLDLGQIPNIGLHLEDFWNDGDWCSDISVHVCVCVCIHWCLLGQQKKGESDAICQPYTKLGYPLVGWH